MEIGVEITDTYARPTGHQPIFGRAVTGPFAGVGWITSFPDLGRDGGTQTPRWTPMPAGRSCRPASLCYLPGPTVTMLRRLA